MSEHVVGSGATARTWTIEWEGQLRADHLLGTPASMQAPAAEPPEPEPARVPLARHLPSDWLWLARAERDTVVLLHRATGLFVELTADVVAPHGMDDAMAQELARALVHGAREIADGLGGGAPIGGHHTVLMRVDYVDDVARYTARLERVEQVEHVKQLVRQPARRDGRAQRAVQRDADRVSDVLFGDAALSADWLVQDADTTAAIEEPDEEDAPLVRDSASEEAP